nr:MAG TPA: hypothetical protein [Bacteriophage sp.]DAV71213.1 MAG TPA: hypothetical protein [Bacteriophage sp.]
MKNPFLSPYRFDILICLQIYTFSLRNRSFCSSFRFYIVLKEKSREKIKLISKKRNFKVDIGI